MTSLLNFRKLGNTELNVSEISFGTWGIGGDWGESTTEDALLGLHRAMELGVNFFDTADVYGNGRSEELLREATKGKEDQIYIASKFCRAGDIHDPQTYSEEAVRAYCEASLKRLGRERIDLYQIHCPPLEILKNTNVFDVLDKLQQEGKIRHYGVSVETVEEGLFCLTNPGVKALQVIFNVFRQKALKELLPAAKEQGVGVLARVPLASGLLTGKFTTDTQFANDDHRQFNANGEQFNVGETFAGLEFSKGVELTEELSWIAEGRESLSSAALRWILDQDAITCAIPGFKNVKQVEQNLQAIHTKPFTEKEHIRIGNFYESSVKRYIRGAY